MPFRVTLAVILVVCIIAFVTFLFRKREILFGTCLSISCLGIMLNLTAVLSNGYRMPVAVSYAPNPDIAIKAVTQSTNHCILDTTTNFPFLCDIFLLPSWICKGIVSIGDIVTSIGILSTLCTMLYCGFFHTSKSP